MAGQGERWLRAPVRLLSPALSLSRCQCTLGGPGRCEVVAKWAEHLGQLGHKGRAVLALLSGGQCMRCLQALHAARMVERAALFLDACLEQAALPPPGAEAPRILRGDALVRLRTFTAHNAGLRTNGAYPMPSLAAKV